MRIVPWLAVAALGCTPLRALPAGPDADVEDGGALGFDAGRRLDGGGPGADAGDLDAAALDAGAADAGSGDAGTPRCEDDPRFGEPCDGSDADGCAEGVFTCVGDTLRCSDETGDTRETCGSGDEDCDGQFDEGPPAGADTWYEDGDGDGFAADDATPVSACVAPSASHVTQRGDCDDTEMGVFPGASESCNAMDDDCDGEVDGGTTCPGCRQYDAAGRVYQVCSGSERWETARSACQSYGYDLVVIRSSTENELVRSFAETELGSGGTAWIGLRMLSGGAYEWVDGSSLSYERWDWGEPDGAAFVFMRTGSGFWADGGSSSRTSFICEIP